MNGTPQIRDTLLFSDCGDTPAELAKFKEQVQSTGTAGSLCLLRSGSSDLTFQLSKIMLACPGELNQHPKLMGFFWTDENIMLMRGKFLWNDVAPLVMKRRIYKRKWLGLFVGQYQKGTGDAYTFSELIETVIGFSLKSGFHLLQDWGYPTFRVLK